jgi:hypothetical protein
MVVKRGPDRKIQFPKRNQAFRTRLKTAGTFWEHLIAALRMFL